MEAHYPAAAPERLIDESLKRMLNAFTGDLITQTGEAIAQAGNGVSWRQVRCARRRLITLSAEMEALRRQAKQYLSTHLYESDAVTPEHERAHQIITSLYECWVRDPSLLPANCASALAQWRGPSNSRRLHRGHDRSVPAGAIQEISRTLRMTMGASSFQRLLQPFTQ